MVVPAPVFSAKVTLLSARPGASSRLATWMVMVLGWVENWPLWSCTEKLKEPLLLPLAVGV